MSNRVVTHRMIEAFRAAMLHGGIGAGADALGIPQPSMSRLIADLQRVVGFPLFQKSGRTIKPTDEALVLMTKVQQSFIGLEDIASFSEQLRKQRTGRFSICTIPSIGHSVMPEIIDHLRSRFPDVVVSLTVSSYLEVAQKVRNRQADIGLTADALSIGTLETVAEFSSDCVCIGTEKWLSASASHVDAGELAGKPFVALTGTFQRQLDALLSANGVTIDAMVEASLFQTVSELVLRGMGVSVVDPLTGAKHRLRGGITLPLKPALSYTVYATAMSDTRLGRPALELLDCLKSATDRASIHIADE
ncbi:MAG TPA: LysR substrate-binding domain-containing protein [Ramlibacter sp.]|uniref:LysR substrate-binding domain-containing protein n=1 Tax=Ramlibacter sp. TaxID=1917967 RepID=UPI002ED4DAE6